MKFGISIPDKWLPKGLQSDSQAVKTVLKDKTKEINRLIVKNRKYVAAMQQDELKLAIQAAEEPLRPRRDLLYEMYRQALTDGHFTGEYEKAINKVVGSPSAIFKKGGKEINELATRLFQRDWFEDYCTYHEEGDVFWGHSLVQFLDLVESREDGVDREFSRINLIPRENVRPEEGYLVLDVNDEKGIPFRDPALAKALRLIEMGKPFKLGKLRIIVKEFIWKNYSRSDWSRHSEKFGMPIVAIKAATSDTKELDKLETMAKEFGNNLYLILDPEDEVDLKEPTFKDSYQIYKEKVLMCNEEMSKATTWQTGSSDQKSFVGAAEVHERILDDYTEWRKRKLTYHINDVLIPFLIEHGYPLKDCEFRFLTYDESNPDQKEKDDNQDSNNGAGGDGRGKKQNQRALYKYRIA
jgi:hypothetical protein